MARALWALARPRGMAFVACLPMIGFAFAYWDHGCEDPTLAPFGKLALLGLTWAVPHAGTMWLNAALDRDEAPTLFGESVPVPRRIELYAAPTFLFALALGFRLGVGVGLCVLGCTALAVLYSHPRTAWKGHALLGPLVNALGYGVLSPLGGFLLSGFAPTLRSGAVLVLSVAWISTAYFAAQSFQANEDRARGYRTLVATHGPRVTLRVTRALFWTAAAGTLAMAAIGWFPRVLLASLPGLVWADRLLARWAHLSDGGDASWAQRFFLRMFVVSAVMLLVVSIDYRSSRDATGRPGGLSTPGGRFEPRACDPASARNLVEAPSKSRVW